MRRLGWLLMLPLLVDCTSNEFQPSTEEKCRLGLFVYGQSAGRDVRFNMSYDISFKVDVLNDEINQSGTWAVQKIYKHIYRNDSLYIRDFTGFKEGQTYITAQLGQKIQQVRRFFPDLGKTYRYTFDYSKSSQVTITLELMVSENVAQFDSRGVYYFDTNADVIRLEIFKNADIYGGVPGEFTYRDIAYTYDYILNPFQNLVFVNFLKPALPDVQFLSMHNRLTAKYGDVTQTYQFTYGTDPMPNKIVNPDNSVWQLEYPNCTN